MSQERNPNSNSKPIYNRSFTESNSKRSLDQIKISEEQILRLISAKQEIKNKISKFIKNISQEIKTLNTKLNNFSSQVIKKLKKYNKSIEDIEDFQVTHLSTNKIESVKEQAELIIHNLNQAISEDTALELKKLNENLQEIKTILSKYRLSKKEIIQSCDLPHHNFDKPNFNQKKKNRIFKKIEVLNHEKGQLKVDLHQITTQDEEINKKIKLLKNKKKDIDESKNKFKNYHCNDDEKVFGNEQEIKSLKKQSKSLKEQKKVVENDLSKVFENLDKNMIKKLYWNGICLIPLNEIHSIRKLIRSMDIVFGQLNAKINLFEKKPSIITEEIDSPIISAGNKDTQENLQIINNLKEMVSFQNKKIEKLEIELDKLKNCQENEPLILSLTFYINYLEKSKEDLIQQIKTSESYPQEYVEKILKDSDNIRNEFLSKQEQFENLLENYTKLYNLYSQQNSTEKKISE